MFRLGGGEEIQAQVHRLDMVVHIYDPSNQEAKIEALLEIWGWLRLRNKTLHKNKKKRKSKQNKTQNRHSAHSVSCGVHFHYMKLAKSRGQFCCIIIRESDMVHRTTVAIRQKANEDCMRTFNEMNVAIVFDDDSI